MFTKHSPNLHKTYVKLTKNLYKTAVNKMVLLEVANEKYRRNNERRRKERRNSNGLTQREQKRVDTVNAIAELREQGLTLQETANRLNMTIDGIKYYLYR